MDLGSLAFGSKVERTNAVMMTGVLQRFAGNFATSGFSCHNCSELAEAVGYSMAKTQTALSTCMAGLYPRRAITSNVLRVCAIPKIMALMAL